MEVFALQAERIAIVQQRALVAMGWQRAFAEALAAWAAQSGFTRLVVLAGVEASAVRCPAHARTHLIYQL